MGLQIIPTDLLRDYIRQVSGLNLSNCFDLLKDADLSNENFSFHIAAAAVYSGRIEGEAIELDSYIKHKRFGVELQPDYVSKTDDLYAAYQFAKNAPITPPNIAQAHALLARHILPEDSQGKFRNTNLYIATMGGSIEYVAAPPFEVPLAMERFYTDLAVLLEREMSIEEVFFFASMIHLVFVKIHPWNDGNGRSARLLEKWFLARKLGAKAWLVRSEEYYYVHRRAYYDNIKALGLEYGSLGFGEAGGFLRMLMESMMERDIA